MTTQDTKQTHKITKASRGWYPRPMTQVTHQDTNASGQTSFLDQARLRPQQPTKYNDLIINTLIKLKNSGRCDSTIKATSYSLKQLSQHADLGNPEQVKTHIANAKTSNATKTKLCQAYNNYCKTNGIQWEKPFYKIAEGTIRGNFQRRSVIQSSEKIGKHKHGERESLDLKA